MEKFSSRNTEHENGYRLYVSHIDPNMKESHIKDLFLNYGNPIYVYRHNNDIGRGWAFVTYATKREADLAIYELNEAKPYNLKVKYAHDSKERDRVRQERERDRNTRHILEEPNQPVDSGLIFPPAVSVGRGLRHFTPQEAMPGQLNGYRNFYDFDSGYYQHYDNEYGFSNDVSTREKSVQSSSFESSRAMRGYSLVEYNDEEIIKISEGIEDLYTKAVEDKSSGKCLVCKKITTRYCRCSAWYCSETCQKSDWHKHKNNCTPLGMSEGTSHINSASFESSVSNNKEKYGKKKKTNKQHVKENDGKTFDKCNNKNEKHNENLPFLDKIHIDDKQSNTSVAVKPKITRLVPRVEKFDKIALNMQDTCSKYAERGDPETLNSLVEFLENGKQSLENVEEAAVSTRQIKTETVTISKHLFERVKITIQLSPMQYWIQREDCMKKLMEIMEVLNGDSKGLPVKSVKEGMICAALYEGLWYRGKVTFVKPELKVHYIDFGNEEYCKLQDLRSVPAVLENIPALAVRIKLAEGTSKKYENLSEDQILSIKCVDVSDDVITVHVEGEEYLEKRTITPAKTKLPLNSSENTSRTSSALQESKVSREKMLISTNSAVLNLKVGTTGACQFRQWLPDKDFGVTLIYPEMKEKFNKLYGILIKEFRNAPKNVTYIPEIGETVAAYVHVENDSEVWSRAQVLSIGKDNYNVNFCDLAQLATVKSVYKLPRELASIPEFGARCSLIGKVRPKVEEFFKQQKRFKFTVINVNEFQKTATCILHMDTEEEEVGTVVLRCWVPFQKEMPHIEVSLKNNEKVIVPAFDLKSLYLRPLRDEFTKIQQDINRYCTSASNIDKKPVKNEIVGCRFQNNGQYYRAQILEVNKDAIKVMYIDFGNIDSVNISKLKQISSDLKKIPSMSVKIDLKDLIDKSMTKSAENLIMKVVREEVKLKVILSGSSKNDIGLILPDGKNLLDEVKKCLRQEPVKKSIEEKPKENKILTENDIKYMELPVGKTIDFVVLHKVDSTLFMGCEANGDIMQRVHGVMTQEMNDYCASMGDGSYEPKYRELCFAKFEDGVWYRGICVSADKISEYRILFLDYGNTSFINKKNIKKMTEEFIQVPVVATLCSLKDMDSENFTEAQKKQLDGLVKENSIYKAHIVSCDGSGNYTVEFLHVTKMLNSM